VVGGYLTGMKPTKTLEKHIVCTPNLFLASFEKHRHNVIESSKKNPLLIESE